LKFATKVNRNTPNRIYPTTNYIKTLRIHFMASSIPPETRQILLADPFMKKCCICGRHPQWHHNLIFATKSVQEPWSILPLCQIHHEEARNREFKRLMDWSMLNRANNEDLAKYSKVMDYIGRRGFLNQVFGKYTPERLREHYANNKHKNLTGVN
jgi:hypothetical protein